MISYESGMYWVIPCELINSMRFSDVARIFGGEGEGGGWVLEKKFCMEIFGEGLIRDFFSKNPSKLK